MIKSGYVAGDNEGYSCNIPTHFRCVFSYEQQPLGLCKHLSVSVGKDKKLPHPTVIEMIMKEFGFKGGIQDQLSVWLEPQENPYAVNVLGKNE